MRVGQLNFSKGEIAEELIARMDVASYAAALKTARNVIVLKYGGIAKRPGTRLVAKAKDSDNPVKLLPFQFSLTSAYALEFGQGYMRAAALGGLVLETPLTITAITNSAAAKVAVAFHGFRVGDPVYFNDVQGMFEINGRTVTVLSVIDDNNFTINLDTSGFGTFTGDTGGVTNSAPPAPPPTPPAVPPPVTPTPPPTVGGGGSFIGGGSTGGSGGGITSGIGGISRKSSR